PADLLAFSLPRRPPPRSTLFPYTTLFRSIECQNEDCPKKSIGKLKRWIKSVDIQGIGDSVRYALVEQMGIEDAAGLYTLHQHKQDRKSTRLNSSHVKISYAVFCLKKKK